MSIRINFTARQSDQIAKVSTNDSSFMEPKDYEGRVRVAYFDFDAGGTAVGVGDKVVLGQLPKGARVIAYRNRTANLGTGAGTINLLGKDDGTTGQELVDTLATNEELNTAAIGHETTDFGFFGIVATAATNTNFTISGYVLYVVD